MLELLRLTPLRPRNPARRPDRILRLPRMSPRPADDLTPAFRATLPLDEPEVPARREAVGRVGAAAPTPARALALACW